MTLKAERVLSVLVNRRVTLSRTYAMVWTHLVFCAVIPAQAVPYVRD